MRTILPEKENPALRLEAKRIDPSQIQSVHIRALIDEMRLLLSREEYGVALAAPQVGESLQLFIVSGKALAKSMITDENAPEPEPLPDQIYINPEIISTSRAKRNKHEGCLSIRGLWGMVPRAEKATIRAYDEHGRVITRGASGFLAHIFQHEVDHLNGILYTDKAVELYEDQEQ